MYINFKKAMERAKIKYRRDYNQGRYVKDGIEFAKRFILDYIKQSDVSSVEELESGIIDLLNEDAQNFATISNIKNAVFEYEILNLFMHNSEEVERTYNKVKAEGEVYRNPHFIDKPFEQRKEDLMRELIKLIEQFKEENKGLVEISEKYKAGDKIAKQLINEKRNRMHSKQKKEFDQQFACLQEGELKMIKVFLPDCARLKGEELKNSYIRILEFIGDFLQDNGLLDKYVQMNDKQLRTIGLPELGIKRNGFDISDIFDRENLEKLKLDELPVMTAFWLNRYTKEIKDFNNGIFAIDTLELWQDLLDGKTEIELTDAQLRAIFCKTEFLDIVNGEVEKSVKEKLNSDKAKITSKEDDVVAVDIRDEIDAVEEIVRVEYYDEFKGVLPNSYSKIIEDLQIAVPLSSNTQNAYDHKDEIITTQILSYMRNKRIKNWGYIKEENENMMILGIDYEGYNMPVKVHIPKKRIADALKEAGLTPQIPMYEGHEDMVIDGDLLKAYVITSLTEPQEKAIKKLVAENTKSRQIMDFLEHLNFLRDSNKYPKHLMKPVIEKGRTYFTRCPRKYINIETNEIFITDKNGRLQKQDSDGR